MSPHLQDLGTPCCIRQRHVDDAVKAARADERSVDCPRPVGGSQNYQTSVVLKAIHLWIRVYVGGGERGAAW